MAWTYGPRQPYPAALAWAEVNRRYRQARRPAQRRHWLVVLSLQADPRPAEVAACQLGVSRSSVNHVVAAYNRRGPAALGSGANFNFRPNLAGA